MRARRGRITPGLARRHPGGAVEAARREELLPPYWEPGPDGHSLDEDLWLVREVSGLDFSHYQPEKIQRSVTRRMTLLNLDGMRAYADYLCDHKEEAEKLYQDIGSDMTGFFRDPETLKALKEKVFPDLVKMRQGDEPLRFWVVDCLTGEEAYSIAIAKGSKRPSTVARCSIAEWPYSMICARA